MLEIVHGNGHNKRDHMVNKMHYIGFNWNNLKNDCANYVKNCDVCVSGNLEKRKRYLYVIFLLFYKFMFKFILESHVYKLLHKSQERDIK